MFHEKKRGAPGGGGSSGGSRGADGVPSSRCIHHPPLSLSPGPSQHADNENVRTHTKKLKEDGLPVERKKVCFYRMNNKAATNCCWNPPPLPPRPITKER